MKKRYVFKSILASKMKNYLTFRRKQGYKTDELNRVLFNLDEYLVSQNIDSFPIGYETIENWVNQNAERISNRSLCAYISHYKGFRDYLSLYNIDLIDIEAPLFKSNYEAYVFSEEEINSLIDTAEALYCETKKDYWAIFAILIRLLYCTGLRISEALNLTVDDVDLEKNIITVQSSKDDKGRIVPFESSLGEILQLYISNCLKSEWLFSARKNKPYSPRRAQQLFHCLRHTFAVHSFRRMTNSGMDMYDQMPVLSVYMGHKNILGTELYIHSAQASDDDIMKLMNDFNQGLFPEV